VIDRSNGRGPLALTPLSAHPARAIRGSLDMNKVAAWAGQLGGLAGTGVLAPVLDRRRFVRFAGGGAPGAKGIWYTGAWHRRVWRCCTVAPCFEASAQR